MEILKIRDEGFVRIPKDILKKLNVDEGDKVAFIEEDDKIVFVKADKTMIAESVKKAVEYLKEAFADAEQFGLNDEQEIVKLVKEVRSEMWKKRNAENND